jgi:sec-independent protein translocase protein TatA
MAISPREAGRVIIGGRLYRALALQRGPGNLESRCFMGEMSPIHWLIVLAIVLLLFGGKKIPEVMRGLGAGVRSFKEGMHGDGTTPPTTPSTPSTPSNSAPTEDRK